MSAARVIVTGPVARMDKWTQAARAAGWTAVERPLVSVEERDVDLVGSIDGLPDWIAITSSNALPALERAARTLPELLSAPLAVVGEASAERARTAGFKTAFDPQPTARNLARQLVDTSTPGASVLWPRGSVSQEFGELLKDAGLIVVDPIVYVNVPLEPEQSFPAGQAIFFASPSAVRAFRMLPPGSSAAAVAIAIGPSTLAALEEESDAFSAILSLPRAAADALEECLRELPETPEPS